MKHLILIIVIVISLTACTKDLGLDFPEFQNQIIVNGIINPDSVIKINLTESIPLTALTDFPPIENAIVTIKENGALIDTLTSKNNGNYVLDYFPKVGNSYQLEVQVPNYELLFAEDIIPQKPKFEACHHRGKYTLKISELSNINYYWISFQDKDYAKGQNSNYDSTRIIFSTPLFLDSNNVLLDNFNAIYDEGSYEYLTYIRLSDRNIQDYPINLIVEKKGKPNLRKADSNQTTYVNITNVSKSYDRYLKSSMIDFLNNDFNDVGAFTKSVPIFSNIENGIGIFAAFNNTRIDVKPFPCDE